MKAAIYNDPGSPDVTRYAEIADPRCSANEVVIEVAAISIEGGDLINRRLNPPLHEDFVIGYAAAGTVVEVGKSVTDRHRGQRLTTFDLSGSHAQLRALASEQT